MVSRKVYEQVNGFEEQLTVAFNDVDFCLKVRKAGYLIVYDPQVEAYHYESKSRGQEDTKEKVERFQREIEYMRSHWIGILKDGDPYYNPNFSHIYVNYSLTDQR
jgi:GT2 family glycosyltransferase